MTHTIYPTSCPITPPSKPLIDFVRITPVCSNQWIGYISGSIAGTTVSTPSGAFISWGATTTKYFDSTVLAPYNTLTGNLTYGLTLSSAITLFGLCNSNEIGAPPGVTFVPCFDPCGTSVPPIPNCVINTDGLLQFIGQICAQPSLQFNRPALNLVIQVPTFPYANPAESGSLNVGYCTPSTKTICAGGNWNAIQFELGACNVCSKEVSLIYVGCPTANTTVLPPVCDPDYCAENPNENVAEEFSVAYANVRFFLAKYDKYTKTYSKASFHKANFLGVEPIDGINATFDVYFAQASLCDSVYILLQSKYVDLNCLYYGTTQTYVVTVPKLCIGLPA